MELMFLLVGVIFGPAIGAIVYVLKPPTWIPVTIFIIAFILSLPGDDFSAIALSCLAVVLYAIATVVTFFAPFVWWFVVIWLAAIISVVVCVFMIKDHQKGEDQPDRGK